MERRLEEHGLCNPSGKIVTFTSTASVGPIPAEVSSMKNHLPLGQLAILARNGPDATTTSTPFTTSPTVPSTPAPNTPGVETNPSISSPTSFNDFLPSSTSPTSSPSNTSNLPLRPAGNSTAGSSNGWESMAGGAHVGVIISIITVMFLVVAVCFWYCCGGRARWSATHENRTENGLPLYVVRGQNTPGVHRPAEAGGDAPPMYAEVAPPEHQTVAGGIRDANEVQRVEDESAVVSDGKTPLSEIPFEDVVLERHASESESSGSSSRGFEQRHHGIGGDTTGHTNT